MNQIRTRRIPFDFPEDIEPYWKDDMPEWCALLNGLSLTMPYLEPFLIQAVRDAAQLIDDPDIARQARSFIEQEAQHFSQHRKFNELLKRKGYPELAEVEADMTRAYARLAEKPLQHRMAYTSGFETMTLGLTRWLVDGRQRLFGGADSRVVSLMLWHIVEEAEHKNVAINVYRAACPGYLPWAFGIFHGAGHVMYYAFNGARVMLRRDGLWRKPATQARLLGLVLSFFATLLPIMLRALLPNHHPRKIADPAWVEQWLSEFELCFPDKEGVPLLDTGHTDLPPRFVRL